MDINKIPSDRIMNGISNFVIILEWLTIIPHNMTPFDSVILLKMFNSLHVNFLQSFNPILFA